MSLTVNGLLVTQMRWLAPWSGVWVAELDYESEATPTGRVAIVSTEGIALSGTVDDKLSGTFGEKRHLRVVGGAGGWGKRVRSQHYHSDVGLPLAIVVSTTAAEAGELATILAPKVLGLDFVRRRGPAAQIFADAGVDWWVGPDGVTRVGARLPSLPPPSLHVLDWDPANGTVAFTCDTLVEPGTVIVDARFGSKVVREVEATVSDGSVSGTLWVVDERPEPGEVVTELGSTIAAMARRATRIEHARFYEYRVVAMAADRVQLEAVNPDTDGMPDVLPASVWAGMSGYKAILTPDSRVLVGFRGGDASKPFVAFYEPPEDGAWRPVTLELDATALLALGAEAVMTTIGPSATQAPVVRLTPMFATWITAVTTALNALAPGSAVLPTDMGSTRVTAG